jgi:hypothetical protein
MVPNQWYGAVGTLFFRLVVVMMKVWHTGMPMRVLLLTAVPRARHLFTK